MLTASLFLGRSPLRALGAWVVAHVSVCVFRVFGQQSDFAQYLTPGVTVYLTPKR